MVWGIERSEKGMTDSKIQSCNTCHGSSPVMLPAIEPHNQNHSPVDAFNSQLPASNTSNPPCPNCHDTPAISANNLNIFSNSNFPSSEDLFSQTISVSPWVAVIEPMPEPLTPNPALEQKWVKTKDKFQEAVDNGDQQQQEALFSELIAIGMERFELPGSYEKLEESKNILERLEDEYEKSKQFSQSTIACHATANDTVGVRPQYELMEMVDAQRKVVEAREKIRGESLDTFETELLYVLENVGGGMPVEDGLPPEMTLSPMAASVFGDVFRSLGDLERAKKYYNVASLNPFQTSTGTVWYRLQALEMDILSGDEDKIKAATAEIEKIRDGLTDLLFSTYDYAINEAISPPQEEGDTVNVSLEGMMPPVVAGMPDQVHEIDALSWGVLYDSYVQLEDYEGLEELETERRDEVRARIGKTSMLEARLHVYNMERVARFKTVRGGAIERALRNDGQTAADKIHQQLKDDVYDIQVLIDRDAKQERGDSLFEGLASLYWMTYFDGYFARDLPASALNFLNEYIIQPRNAFDDVPLAETNSVEALLARLHTKAPHLFTESGQFNPNVDMSDTPLGKEAAERTMTAYWKSNDIAREVGLPLGAAVGCFAVGALFSETVIVPIIAAGICSAGGSLANREINEASAGEQYRQATITGMTQITSREAKGYANSWYLTEGMNGAFNAAMVAPMLSIWGRAGYSAVKTGLFRAGAWAIAGTGGRAVLQTAASPLRLMGQAAMGVGRTAKTVGGWYWKLPVGTRLRLAGLLPAGADYGFVDREGNLVSWDGELNQWYGYAGWAAVMSEGGYQLFRNSWQPAFSSAVTASPIRNNIIRLGVDMISTDYYMITDDYGLVDFGAPRGTSREEHAYKAQFGVDNWVGYGGMILLGGDWLQSEFRIMSTVDRTLLVGGAVPVAIDLADGDLDSWYGGVGGSVVTAELGYRLLNVSAAGSMVFLPMKLSYEWLMQAQQDVPLQAPDPQRMISSTAESIFMLMLVKGSYQGTHYWNTFPLGKNLATLHEQIPVIRGIRSFEDLGRYSCFGGNKAAIEGWTKGTVLKPLNARGSNSFNGNGRVINYKLRGDKTWNGVAKGKSDVTLRVTYQNGSPTPQFFINEKLVGEQVLLEHGYVWRNNALYEFQPIRRGYVQFGGQKMTADQVLNLNNGARAAALSELRQSGWRVAGNHFERWWIKHPYHPEILFKRPPANTMSTPAHKIFESSINGQPVWLKFSRQTMKADEVTVGAKKFDIWRGQREKPHFTVRGVLTQAGPILGEAYASNYFIFRKTARGDPVYQPLQRFGNYLPTVLLTWPIIQNRFGLDSAKGRFYGGLIGYPVNLMANWVFPTYRNTAPGQETLYAHLDAGGSVDKEWYSYLNSNDAFDSFGRITTSLQFMPWGPKDGSLFEVEKPAMDNLRHGLDCRMDLANNILLGNSDACVLLPQATQEQILSSEDELKVELMKKRFDIWAAIFREKMDEEKTGNLSARERRLLIMLGAWFKSILKDADRYKPLDPDEQHYNTLGSLRNLRSDYAWFFEEVPYLMTESDWSDFIEQVNAGRSSISNFYFDPHLQPNAGSEH